MMNITVKQLNLLGHYDLLVPVTDPGPGVKAPLIDGHLQRIDWIITEEDRRGDFEEDILLFRSSRTDKIYGVEYKKDGDEWAWCARDADPADALYSDGISSDDEDEIVLADEYEQKEITTTQWVMKDDCKADVV